MKRKTSISGIAAAIVTVMLIGCVASPYDQEKRGEWRWDVKTLTDVNSDAVNIADVISSSIKKQRNLIAPDKLQYNTPRFGTEFHVYKLTGKLIQYKIETDGDIHLVISSVDNDSETMITEIPDATKSPASGSKFVDYFKDAKDSLINILKRHPRHNHPDTLFWGVLYKPLKNDPIYLTITGVGFFDKIDGSIVQAPNGRELHPVLGIEETKP